MQKEFTIPRLSDHGSVEKITNTHWDLSISCAEFSGTAEEWSAAFGATYGSNIAGITTFATDFGCTLTSDGTNPTTHTHSDHGH